MPVHWLYLCARNSASCSCRTMRCRHCTLDTPRCQTGTYSSSYWIVPETNICIIQAAALKARAEDSTSLISTTNMMICIFLLKDSVSEVLDYAEDYRNAILIKVISSNQVVLVLSYESWACLMQNWPPPPPQGNHLAWPELRAHPGLMEFTPGLASRRPERSSCVVVSTPEMEAGAYHLRLSALTATTADERVDFATSLVAKALEQALDIPWESIQVASAHPEDYLIRFTEPY
ncbi:hypothetical protein ZWY2020_048689 [Hordeum vulgare]|nr:hypothetical protein ZWY2020_048689 [Hordeum vulgare]